MRLRLRYRLPRAREQRLVDELLRRSEELRLANATIDRVLAESRQMVAVAKQSASFAADLSLAVGLYTEALADLRAIEKRHGIRRPSQCRSPITHDFPSLWRAALADPN